MFPQKYFIRARGVPPRRAGRGHATAVSLARAGHDAVVALPARRSAAASSAAEATASASSRLSPAPTRTRRRASPAPAPAPRSGRLRRRRRRASSAGAFFARPRSCGRRSRFLPFGTAFRTLRATFRGRRLFVAFRGVCWAGARPEPTARPERASAFAAVRRGELHERHLRSLPAVNCWCMFRTSPHASRRLRAASPRSRPRTRWRRTPCARTADRLRARELGFTGTTADGATHGERRRRR